MLKMKFKLTSSGGNCYILGVISHWKTYLLWNAKAFDQRTTQSDKLNVKNKPLFLFNSVLIELLNVGLTWDHRPCHRNPHPQAQWWAGIGRVTLSLLRLSALTHTSLLGFLLCQDWVSAVAWGFVRSTRGQSCIVGWVLKEVIPFKKENFSCS